MRTTTAKDHGYPRMGQRRNKYGCSSDAIDSCVTWPFMTTTYQIKQKTRHTTVSTTNGALSHPPSLPIMPSNLFGTSGSSLIISQTRTEGEKNKLCHSRTWTLPSMGDSELVVLKTIASFSDPRNGEPTKSRKNYE